MRITVVSRYWPACERSGVTLAAAEHVKMLVNDGHEVSIIGSNSSVIEEKLPVVERIHVQSSGSGALYSPSRIDKSLLRQALAKTRPNLVIIEGWQTAITDAAVDVSNQMNIPILMISHGVSVHPFSFKLVDVMRAIGWIYYRLSSLPNRIKKLSLLTTLDEKAVSNRFYDRDLAHKFGITVSSLVNTPIHLSDKIYKREERKLQIVLIGYYSEIKNQLGALEVIHDLPEIFKLRFIGPRKGAYYQKCLKRVNELGLTERVMFSQDDECEISSEIAASLVVLSTSITEVLPITLLEAMANGTPFVATPVGAVPSLGAGIIAANSKEQRNAILALANDDKLWNRTADLGRLQYQLYYSSKNVYESLCKILSPAAKENSQR